MKELVDTMTEKERLEIIDRFNKGKQNSIEILHEVQNKIDFIKNMSE